ncbi:hypothetical protein CIK66_18505, partial [Brachybacterium alimentarium]
MRDYRSVNDSGEFEVEHDKTILVGINEAGKTCLLTAMEQLNAPAARPKFKALTDYPRARYTEVQRGDRPASDVSVVVASFELDADDRRAVEEVGPDLGDLQTYQFTRRLDNSSMHWLPDAPPYKTFREVEEDLQRVRKALQAAEDTGTLIEKLDAAVKKYTPAEKLIGAKAETLDACLSEAIAEIDEENERELTRLIAFDG